MDAGANNPNGSLLLPLMVRNSKELIICRAVKIWYFLWIKVLIIKDFKTFNKKTKRGKTEYGYQQF